MKTKETINKTKKETNKEELERALKKCYERIGIREKEKYILNLLRDLVLNKSIPIELLEKIPENPKISGKTRFDQIYDASCYLAFPPYEPSVRYDLNPESDDIQIKAWKVIFPREYGVSDIVVRASSYQEAFALGCDYACRVSLRINKKIPKDLTIRVKYVKNGSLKYFFRVRNANKIKKRAERNHTGNVLTPKQVTGAQIAALGHEKGSKNLKIARYVEVKDLLRVRTHAGLVRTSAVVTEHFKSDEIDEIT